MDKSFKSAYIDGLAMLMAALTGVKVNYPSCNDDGDSAQDELHEDSCEEDLQQ